LRSAASKLGLPFPCRLLAEAGSKQVAAAQAKSMGARSPMPLWHRDQGSRALRAAFCNSSIECRSGAHEGHHAVARRAIDRDPAFISLSQVA